MTAPVEPKPARSAYPWLVLATCLGLVATTAALAATVLGERAESRAAFATAEVVRSVERRMDMYLALLRGTAALFASDPAVDREQFRRFVRRLRLENYPGIQGIGWSRRLAPGDEARVVEEARAAGEEGFRLWPPHDGERHAILFLEPENLRNSAALGYDMFSEAVRRTAMERARDEGLPAASAVVRLVQEIEREVQPGFLVYVPVYEGGGIPPTVAERREHLVGFAYAPFRAGDLFGSVFEGTIPPPSVAIYEGDAPDPAHLLFSIQQTGRHATTRFAHVTVAGRDWLVEVRPPADLVSDARFVAGAILLLGGILSVFLARSLQAREAADRARGLAAAALEEETHHAQLRETFLGVLGHDLRNPLGAAKANAQLLLRRLDPDDPRRASLERIDGSIGRATRLVEQLLDVTRVRLGGGIRVDTRPVALAPLVREVVTEARQAAGEGPAIEVEIPEDLLVLADPDRLAQIVSNLAGNALAYGQPPVRIRARTDGRDVALRISNGGKPIPPETLVKLFDPFKRGERGRDASPGGLGLGLYISRQLAIAHGGSLDACSDPDLTVFELRLPRA